VANALAKDFVSAHRMRQNTIYTKDLVPQVYAQQKTNIKVVLLGDN
jgi:hypothetical protein